MISDDRIIQSVLDGNTQNFEIIVERYGSRIINFINKMILDGEEAQNLAQDVFFKIFEELKHYKMQGNFKTFIFTIARNRTLNHIKRHKRMVFFSRLPENSNVDKYYSTHNNPDDDIEKKEKERLLLKGLKRLKENQRLALILKVYLEMSYKEIADVTEWSIPKIETLISRAKQNLKKILQDIEDNVVV